MRRRRAGGKYFHVSRKMIIPYSSSRAGGREGHPTPACHGLPQSDLSRRERGHTSHTTGNKNSPAADITLPLTLAPRHFQPFLPLFKLSSKHRSVTPSEFNTQMEPCECRAVRGVLSCRGHSPANVNQISCRCS